MFHSFQAHYSTGAVAASFTSTATDRATHQEAGEAVDIVCFFCSEFYPVIISRFPL